MGRKIAFNINFYEKFREVEILLEILEQEFGDVSYVNVMCNDTSRDPETLEHRVIDNYEIEETFTLDESKVDLSGSKRQKLLMLRILDQFTKGMRICARESDAKYTVNLHADAWPLSADGIADIINEIEETGRPFGSRGYGWAYTHGNSPYGFLMDIFLVAENEVVREYGVFDYDPKKLILTIPNSHGTIAAMIHFRYGADGIHWYSNLIDTYGWDERQKNNVAGAMTPLVYEPEYKLLHFNTNWFLDDYGYRFMSKYLESHGFTDGETIEQHLQQYPPGDGLIEEYEEKLATHPVLRRKERAVRHDSNPNEYDRDMSRLGEWALILKSNARNSPLLRGGYKQLRSWYRNYLTDYQDPGQLQAYYLDNREFLDEVARQLGQTPPLDGVLDLEVGTLDESSVPVFQEPDSDSEETRW